MEYDYGHILRFRLWLCLCLYSCSVHICSLSEVGHAGGTRPDLEINRLTMFDLLQDGKHNLVQNQYLRRSFRFKRNQNDNSSKKWRTSVSGLSNLDYIQNVLNRRNALPMSAYIGFS
ncbi:uncharacterized protein LOC123537447 isoform X2 [Mercenaria mercenaria]|uniref:uncharacterized protein LOC123537447 isoform X2 n=1 Tax=Mercenaria mercenaria TaxID=6596 RepID=UPI00234F905B|nr:uncharacterized protein LOC123537447 isoform X2 [Mercenaria mercenaria]